MAGPKPLLTEFGIYHRMESCVYALSPLNQHFALAVPSSRKLTFPQFLLLDHKWYYWLLVHQLWFNGKKNIVLYYNSEKSLYPLDMASSEIEKKKMAGNRRKFSG